MGTSVWERRGRRPAPAARASAWRRSGWWGDHGLIDWWDLAVRASPEALAVVDRAGRSYTYAEADAASSRLASWLVERGVGPGDLVPVQLPNWSQFLPVLIAVAKSGATIVPLSPMACLAEWADVVEQCEPRVAILPDRFRRADYAAMARELLASPGPVRDVLLVGAPEDEPLAAGARRFEDVVRDTAPLAREDWRRSAGDDIAAILFTSGSEAAPKGVMLSHNNMIASEEAFAYALRLGCDDAIFMPSPPGPCHGLPPRRHHADPHPRRLRPVRLDRWRRDGAAPPGARGDLRDVRARRHRHHPVPVRGPRGTPRSAPVPVLRRLPGAQAPPRAGPRPGGAPVLGVRLDRARPSHAHHLPGLRRAGADHRRERLPCRRGEDRRPGHAPAPARSSACSWTTPRSSRPQWSRFQTPSWGNAPWRAW